jgi:hypothetical protein
LVIRSPKLVGLELVDDDDDDEELVALSTSLLSMVDANNLVLLVRLPAASPTFSKLSLSMLLFNIAVVVVVAVDLAGFVDAKAFEVSNLYNTTTAVVTAATKPNIQTRKIVLCILMLQSVFVVVVVVGFRSL